MGSPWCLSKTRKVNQLAPVTERHLYSSAPGCVGVHERPIRNEFDALLHSEHPRVLHPLVGVTVGKRHSAIDQADGKDVLTVDVRHRAVVDDACTVFGSRATMRVTLSAVRPCCRRKVSSASSGA